MYHVNFDDRKYILNQMWKNDKCWCECKNPKELNELVKDYIWNPATYIVNTQEVLLTIW